ncbi:MAG: hypothetical protein JXQ65_05500 [Candidatus Marinimicrobia bacterium]|nr:hypothetical protein [Candidatus Neomarinimicrobiota bacterium]
MKKSIRFMLLITGLIILWIISCESNTHSKPEIFGEVESFSNCKYLNKRTGLSKIKETLPDTLAGIEYHYDGKSKLEMTHINAGFNCCPGIIFTEITEDNGDIIIEEFESEASCRCNCLYDLKIVIDDIQPGNYCFTFAEPYLPEGNKTITFILGLNEKNEGLVTFPRKGYPWGE